MKGQYESIIQQKDAQNETILFQKESDWKKKQNDVEHDCKKKLVKLMHDTFEQIQTSQNNAQLEKDTMTNIFQEKQLNDENVITELEKKIKKNERQSIVMIKNINDKEIENKLIIERIKKEMELSLLAYQGRESVLKDEIEKKENQLKNYEDMGKVKFDIDIEIQIRHDCGFLLQILPYNANCCYLFSNFFDRFFIP